MYKNYEDLGKEGPQNQDQHQVLEIANSQHMRQVLANHAIVVVDIYADWCGPCKQISPTYGVMANTYSQQGLCAMVKYNLDRMSPQEKANIHGIPLFQFYVRGRKTDTDVVGGDLAQVEDTLKSLLQKFGQGPNGQNPNGNGQNPNGQNPSGPQHSKNTIRSIRSSMPETDSGQPYRPSGGGNYLAM